MEELSDSMMVNLSEGVVEDEGEWSDNCTESLEKKRDSWVDAGSLSEELRLLDEEQKRQIEEARQWLEEEEAADEMLRRDLDELQLAEQRNHELSARLIAPEPELPPDVQERLDLLDTTVKSLQEQLNDRNVKLSLKNDSYSELLSKFNSMTERLLNTDREFKQTLAHVKGEYKELEKMLRGKMKTYQDLNKQLELELNERETEVIGLHDKLTEYDTIKQSVSQLQDKLNDSTKSVNHLNKIVVALKGKLKTMKGERDSLVQERDNAEPIEPLKQKIVELEGGIAGLLEERKKFEDIESLKNRITLLEEEKGNLQLQLVDLDELKDSAESFKLLKEKLEKEKSELENVLQDVNKQNSELLSEKETATKMFEEQESAIVKLKSALQETTEDKIAAVMKAVELEEALTQKEKDIFYLKDALKILEAEKVETSKQIQLRPDGDSELLSDYNMSNGLQVKLTVLEDELANCKEKERALMVIVSELQTAREELELQLRAALADKETAQAASSYFVEGSIKQPSVVETDLEIRLSEALQKLNEQRDDILKLEDKLNSALQENDKLSKALSEREPPSSGNLDATAQKLKKLAAMYKKRCSDMEVEINNLKTKISCKNEEVRYQDIVNETKKLEHELVELYSFINEFNHIPKERISSLMDLSKVEHALTFLTAWSERTGTTLPPSDWVPPPISSNQETDDLIKTLLEKEVVLQSLENDKEELDEKLTASLEELKMLRELYEKESDKNSQFQTDLIALEAEMSESKSELFGRLEEATKALQNRENYIEVLEQDIVNMKTKMFSIESGMDNRHRELKERAQTMITKLEEAELMSKGFDKYKSEIDHQLATLTESEKSLKEQLIDVQAKLEEAEEESSATKLRNSVLESEKIQSDDRFVQMQTELDTLRDVRKAYNDTLDEIEVLNGGLKEAMEGFDAKNNKLDLLESERQELINKLTDLEDGFGDLEKKLEDSDKENGVLKLTIESLSKTLQETQLELNQSRILSESGQSNMELIEKEVRELDKFYQDKINVLNESKEKLELLLSRKNEEVGTLQQAFDSLSLNYENKTSELENIKQGLSIVKDSDPLDSPFGDEEGWGDNLMPSVPDSAESPESPRIADLLNSIQHLRTEKERALQDLDALKINYKKVLKKLKELKVDKAKMDAKSSMSDLEMALQEELRNENDALLTKMNEIVKQADVLKKEKDSLSKRVDTLTSANDQLVDMKERQDVEVQMWQKRSAELNERVHHLQWSLDEIQFRGSDDELSTKCGVLFAENVELSKALNLKKEELELAIAREQDLEKEIEELKANFDKIEKNTVKNEEAIQPSPAAFFDETKNKSYDQLLTKYDSLVAENSELQTSLNEKNEELTLAIALKQKLEKEIEELKDNFDKIEKIALKNDEAIPPSTAAFFDETKNESYDQLLTKYDSLVVENAELQMILNKKNEELSLAIALEQKLEKEISDLNLNLQNNRKSVDANDFRSAASFFESADSDNSHETSNKYTALVAEYTELQTTLNRKNEELGLAIAREQKLENEILHLKSNFQQNNVPSAAAFFESTNLDSFNELSNNYADVIAKYSELQTILNRKDEELALAVAHEQTLDKEISDLKAQIEKIKNSDVKNVPNAASNDLFAQYNALVVEHKNLLTILNNKNEELELAVARQLDLEKELTNLKGNFHQIVEPAATNFVPNAAVLFQGTASSFDSLFPSSLNVSVPPPQVPSSDSKVHADLENRISLLTAQNVQLAERIDQTVPILTDKDTKLHQLENQVASQKAYFDEQVQDLERNFQKALLDRDEDNAHLVCTVSAKEQALTAANQELFSLREQVSNVESKLYLYEKDNFNLQSEIAGLKNYIEASNDSAENEHLSTILNLKNQISTLENAQNDVANLLQCKDTQIEKLTNFLKEREEELSSCRVEIESYLREIERLKSQDTGDTKILAAMYELTSSNQDLQVTVNNQTEQLRDKDNLIIQLQNDINRLETTVETTNSNLNETKNNIGFLEEERLRLETLVQNRLDEVAQYEGEIQRLKTTSSVPSNLDDAASQVVLISEKDAEIARLTKSVIEIQERLLLSEQGKLNPQLRVVQSELDKALYTVHLRDVRIEELTLEIRQLVEERDLLQLSLSDALRKAEPSQIDSPPKLQIKERLSELHAAGYKKDPLVQSEREARHAQHMELYTGRVSPQEDQAADYGIFNWFFGGSSPSTAGHVDVSDNS